VVHREPLKRKGPVRRPADIDARPVWLENDRSRALPAANTHHLPRPHRPRAEHRPIAPDKRVVLIEDDLPRRQVVAHRLVRDADNVVRSRPVRGNATNGKAVGKKPRHGVGVCDRATRQAKPKDVAQAQKVANGHDTVRRRLVHKPKGVHPRRRKKRDDRRHGDVPLGDQRQRVGIHLEEVQGEATRNRPRLERLADRHEQQVAIAIKVHRPGDIVIGRPNVILVAPQHATRERVVHNHDRVLEGAVPVVTNVPRRGAHRVQAAVAELDVPQRITGRGGPDNSLVEAGLGLVQPPDHKVVAARADVVGVARGGVRRDRVGDAHRPRAAAAAEQHHKHQRQHT